MFGGLQDNIKEITVITRKSTLTDQRAQEFLGVFADNIRRRALPEDVSIYTAEMTKSKQQ